MLKEGIYEDIINLKLKKELAGFNLDSYEIGKEPIDVEEARNLYFFSYPEGVKIY